MKASKRARRAAGMTSFMTVAAASIAMAAGGTGAPTTYPDADGWTFAAGEEGWTAADGDCLILGNIPNPIPPLCEVASSRTDDGFLRTELYSLVNAAGVFEGSGTWTGPKFTVADDPAMADDREISAATLDYKRRLVVDQLLVEKGSKARSDVFLVEGDKRTLLQREELSVADSGAVVRRTRDLGATAVRPGGTYNLEITTFLTTEDAQVLDGIVAVDYDDVKLVVSPTVDGEDGATGPTGPQGDAGAAGPTGPTGADGQNGTDGEDGTDGQNGTDGKDGQNGTNGKDGQQGAQGAPGPAGPAGPVGMPGREASVVNSEEARRLLTIYRLQPFLTRGPFAKQLRTRVFCRRGAEKRCEGVVKIRTLNKVNEAFMPGRRVMKRVTLGTGAYRLNIGQVGYAKVFTTSLAQKIIAKRGPLKVEVLFTALDETGGQQTLRRVFTLRQAKK